MITTDDVARLAALARIALSPEESDRLTRDIAAILEYVSEIQGVAGDASPDADPVLQSVMRDDSDPHESEVFSADLLNAAPRTTEGYIVVKKIL